MRVIAYLRVSTDIQAEKGLGLPVQAGAIRAWARDGRHKVTATYSDEGVSGSNGLSTRPGLATAFRDLEDGRADALVVYRLDRLARKLIHQETWIERLEQAGRKVVSVTEPDYGEDETRVFVRQVFGALAEYERAVITRRLQSGRKAKAEQGGYAYGSPPYGWRSKDGELVPVPAEQAVLATMAAQRQAGRSYREIAGALNDAGTPARRGRWHPTTVARALGRAGKAGEQAILCGCGSPLVRDGAAWAHLYSEAAGAASDHEPAPGGEPS